jgi:spermidine/putrescine transport system substrate-binding protein
VAATRRSSGFAKPLSILVPILLVLGAGGLARSVHASAQSDAEGDLTVLDWAGFDAEGFWIDFKQQYPNVDVTFEMGASDADIFAKVQAGDQADVFHPYTGWLQFYVEEGLVEEIDTSKLTNWDKVPERFKQLGQFDGKQYFVPYDWGYSSILYRTDMIPEGVTSWSSLFDPKYSGHISMWDDGVAAVQVACYAHGWDSLTLTEEQLEQIEDEWVAQREHNLFYWTAEPELVEAMASGDVWLAYAWQGAYALLRAEDVPVAYANPEEGRNSWVGYYGIRKDSDNYDLALAFLDDKLALRTGQNVVNLFYYGHASDEVMASITDPELIEVLSINDPAVLDQTRFTENISPDQRDEWAEMWVDVKAS